MSFLWYVAYGSNLHAARLDWYLRGGRPPGGLRAYPGCRDCRPPRRTVPVLIPGGIYFAGESRAWTGGMAFYDPELPGRAAVRGYLVTIEQFADIAAQEMYRPPGADLAGIRTAAGTGRATLGPGRYETLLRVGERDGLPMLTFTAGHRAVEVPWNRPAAVYLGMLARGLREAHGWDVARTVGYLAGRPGVAGRWSGAALRALVRATHTGSGSRPSGARVEFGQSVPDAGPVGVNGRSVRDG
ncbi:histone deacetylase [Micromonospora sp. WMMD980]|uniref:histone deacetylase n=1 Tax=Micromonospora sp. WMMD980 TaxID=3016088 RepID=UPI00241599BF|nr:histone deacetylase [Micromonospora sp. WMMD980]MDG4804224.1 histone deacetylase [Micromonospora sp. WMMD980]